MNLYGNIGKNRRNYNFALNSLHFLKIARGSLNCQNNLSTSRKNYEKNRKIFFCQKNDYLTNFYLSKFDKSNFLEIGQL